MIIKNDNELMCAYLDNQLSSSEKKEFEKRLREESDLQALLSQFREIDQAYIIASDKENSSPIPESVLSLLQEEKPKKLKAFRAWPIAASVAVISIVATLNSTRPDNEIEVSMFNALDNAPSAEFIWLDEQQTSSMLINLSFQHNNGQYCREFILDRQGQASHQIACKTQQWNIEFTVPTAPLSENETYIPAAEAHNSAIEDYLNKSMQGDGMDKHQEQASIARKWQ